MKQARIGIAALVLAIVVPTQHCFARQGATEKQMAGELASLIDAYVELSQWEDPPEPRKNIQTQVESLLVKMIENESQKVEQRKSVLFWTNVSANVTFILAHILLVIGIYSAWRELRHAAILRRTGTDEPIEIKVGIEGVALKSSAMGFAVFLVTLAFYFAYLKFVYPIITI